jgi:hypothetical protein
MVHTKRAAPWLLLLVCVSSCLFAETTEFRCPPHPERSRPVHASRIFCSFIGEYKAALASPTFAHLQTTKNFNTDFLFTYLAHRSTAIYVGYNSNVENVHLSLGTDSNGELLHDPRGGLAQRRLQFLCEGVLTCSGSRRGWLLSRIGGVRRAGRPALHRLES